MLWAPAFFHSSQMHVTEHPSWDSMRRKYLKAGAHLPQYKISLL